MNTDDRNDIVDDGGYGCFYSEHEDDSYSSNVDFHLPTLLDEPGNKVIHDNNRNNSNNDLYEDFFKDDGELSPPSQIKCLPSFQSCMSLVEQHLQGRSTNKDVFFHFCLEDDESRDDNDDHSDGDNEGPYNAYDINNYSDDASDDFDYYHSEGEIGTAETGRTTTALSRKGKRKKKPRIRFNCNITFAYNLQRRRRQLRNIKRKKHRKRFVNASKATVLLPSINTPFGSLSSFPNRNYLHYTEDEELMIGGHLPTLESDLCPRFSFEPSFSQPCSNVVENDTNELAVEEGTKLPEENGENCSQDQLYQLEQQYDKQWGDENSQTYNLNKELENDLHSKKEQQERVPSAVKCRSFHIVTTAALPWMTGTAVNPLLRAAYLNKMNRLALHDFVLTHQKQQFQTTSEETSLNVGGSPVHSSILSSSMQEGDLISQHSSAPIADQNVEDNEASIHKIIMNSKHYRDMMGKVTLVIPWLIDKEDQTMLYGENNVFRHPHQQELYIRNWLKNSAELPLEADLDSLGIYIVFYPARYSSRVLSIFPLGDICNLIADKDADVCFLEEPEHLNLVRPTDNSLPWTKKFRHVVGIIHTNYKAYASCHPSGIVSSPICSTGCSFLARSHCHRIVKLSDTLQTFAPEKEIVCNTHGIRSQFLVEGKRRGNATLARRSKLRKTEVNRVPPKSQQSLCH